MDLISAPTLEEHALGCLIFDPRLHDDCFLSENDFTDPRFRELYSLVKSAAKRHGCPDATVILTMVESNRELRELVVDLVKETAGTTSFNSVQAELRERTVRRRLVDAAREIDQTARESRDKLSSILDHCQSLVGEIAINQSGETMTGAEAVGRLIDQLDELSAGKFGLTTGFSSLDRRVRGLRPGSMWVIAGRPSMGKTTFALEIGDHCAIRLQKQVMVFSLEMSAEQLMAKSIACVGEIPMDSFLDGTAASHPRFLDAVSKVKTDRLIIDDTAGLTMHALASKARRQKRRGLDMIIIDYIGLIRGDSDSRTEDITRISAGIKGLAKELRVPIIALSQLNRGVEQREDKRPVMSDLRESGALEQDADLITMLYREEYYRPATPNKGVAEVITRKHRMGEVGTDYLLFDGAHSKFRELPASFTPSNQPDSAFA